MQGPRIEALRSSIRAAIAAGQSAFDAREKAKLAVEGEEERTISAHGAARFSEVLSALPQRITDAIASAEALPVQCIVTFVRRAEYEGDILHPSSSRSAKPIVDPLKLRGAAAWIFEELQMAGCEPTLRFEYPFASANLNAQPGIWDQLCICIAVHK